MNAWHVDFAQLLSVHWLRPHWLWLLLALPLLVVATRALQRQRNIWRDVVDPHLLPHLLETPPRLRARGGPWLALLGATLAICALAGPSWQKARQPLWQDRAPLVIALDLSSATLATDLPPSRLLQARAAIAQLLRDRAGGQVALVAFADDAYTVAPLTADAANVALFLDALSPDVMPVDGSRADRAIAWSARLLKQAGFEQGDILVLSDHADATARSAAGVAHRAGYRVSVLGLGTATGAAYRDGDGRIDEARLDADALRALASVGGGEYASLQERGTATPGLLQPRDAAAGGGGETTSVWRDQGYWLLLPLLLLALFAFRRGGAFAVLLLCAWLPWQPARAAGGWWQRPDQQAHAQLLQGAQAYRRNDYAGATQRWRALPGADAAYNLGNALAEQGDYDAAIAAYDRALRMRPGMTDAIENRRKVEDAKKRQPPKPQQQSGQRSRQPQSGRQSGQQPSGQRQPGQQQSGQQQSEQQQSPQQSPSNGPRPPEQASGQRRQHAQPQPSQGAAETPPQAGDAAQRKAQQQADAAQRRQMEQALKKTAGDQPRATSAPGARAETPAARERRLANEAWLRRVPDDPGGLLREKFRLEYERRQQEGR